MAIVYNYYRLVFDTQSYKARTKPKQGLFLHMTNASTIQYGYRKCGTRK